MLLIIIIASVVASMFNGLSTLLQRLATGTPDKSKLFKLRFVVDVTKHPLFLIGLLFQVTAAGIHLFALSKGSLLLVQPLLTLDLVFLFLILHFKYHLQTGKKEWLAVLAIVIGVGLLFIVSDPQSGHAPYNGFKWLILLSLGVIVSLICVYITKKSEKANIRAITAGLATAISYALNASLAKLTLTILKHHSLLHLFLRWPVYGLIISAIVSIILMQSAYGSGPLVISQPIMETVTPLLSALVGLIIFGDTIRNAPSDIVGELLCSALMVWGIFTLGGSKKLYIKLNNKD